MLEKKVSSTPRGNPKIVAVKPKIQPPARKKKTFYLYYSNSEWRLSGKSGDSLSHLEIFKEPHQD